ncbi:MAG: murein biosynthesis integral membrane protein MurJ [Legionellaceae bacterium]|nr:murein biosynthesis integral membrane protein MurJ [Legionellaceae bacterium]
MSTVLLMKKSTLLKSTSLVSIFTFFSRCLGFFRDMVIAQFFGAEAGMDAFLVAFRIPNFMRRLFAEGAFAQAFVPVLSEYQATRPSEDVRVFIAHIAGNLSAVLSLVTALGILLAPWIITIFAPGFESMRAELASEMLRITFPYLFFISLTAMAGAVLNTYGYFGVPAITPIFLNICMIMAVWYFTSWCHIPVVGVAWGVFVAGVVQCLFQLPFLYHKGLLVKPAFNWKDQGVNRVLKLMVPALFGVSIAQLNLMVDSMFASFLAVGSVSWLYFTDRLTDFPLGVFGVAIATVILPYLSRRYAAEHADGYSRALDWGLRLLLLLGCPAALGLALFSMPLIVSCFGYGAFSAHDVLQTQKSLITLALGVPAFMMIKVLASGYYARQDIKTPVKIGAWCMLINSILCAILIYPLAHAGLTLASALAGYMNALCLLIGLKRQGVYCPQPGWKYFIFQLTLALLGMALYLGWIQGTLSDWMNLPARWRLAWLLLDVFGAMGIYVAILTLLGLRVSAFRGQLNEGVR